MMSSFHPLWKQAEGIKQYIRATIAADTTDSFSAGYHLVCHSQGALTCRAVVETMDDHHIHTFVSLAGPQMGIYGPYGPMKSIWAEVC
ncbi:hypothetical protein SARC_16537 [Sphaeroforma arctica JP610]|uniref:palmitoyl-CoA hydrolase n=1 Tax=Sphaeroforma arctica JP610 TaxID=667725 RepID=A0A0L0F2T5_9EUKA|nr:hypothetical protein SARC_16537 [Sphaeroforma arctica JP610]KNC70931.1 hypothetical protein SARC_16537 [Sphaeroforma arctica JP610]|eukprot:XP_014144833.1 hypothetical protein SARC_16537 [Sphaeroforma arctica JP610]